MPGDRQLGLAKDCWEQEVPVKEPEEDKGGK